MESNTELHQLARRPLSLYKLQVDSLTTTTDAGDLRHEHAENHSRLTLHS